MSTKILPALALMFLLSNCVTAEREAEKNPPDFVIIDSSKPAYTVFVTFSRAEMPKAKAFVTKVDAQILTFEAFVAQSEQICHHRIIWPEYNERRTIKGFVDILRKHSGIPIGLTWNAGVAYTRNDYRNAETRYIAYVEDAKGYIAKGRPSPRLDPINPQNFFDRVP